MAKVLAERPAQPNPPPRPSTASPGGLGLRQPAAPTFLPLQQCKLFDQPPTGAGWLHEMKFDGYRMQIAVQRGRATWFSRNGHNWTTRLPDFAELLADLPDCVLDGELCALRPDARSDFSALRSAMSRREAGAIVGDLRFYAFDVLRHGREDLRPSKLADRKEHLEALLHPGCEPLSPRLVYADPLPGEGPDLLQAACRLQLEGVVSKRLDAPYCGGPRRLDTWRKSKCRPGQEVVIGGFEMDRARFRSLLAGVWEEGRFTYVGHIGTGFGQATVLELLPRLRTVESGESPFEAGGAPRRGVRWTRPELVANVEIAEWNAAGKMRQASFKGLRFDKPPREVVRERPT